jgi:ABC-type transporter Mla maintaining outer membrane lipid asymmetry ATPase subunit MlaF
MSGSTSYVQVRDIWQAYNGRSIIERVNLDVAVG